MKAYWMLLNSLVFRYDQTTYCDLSPENWIFSPVFRYNQNLVKVWYSMESCIWESSFRIVTVRQFLCQLTVVSWNSYQKSKFVQLREAASESFGHGQISDGQVGQVPHWLEQSQTPLRIVNLKMIQLNLKLVKCMLTLEFRCIPVLGWGVFDFLC